MDGARPDAHRIARLEQHLARPAAGVELETHRPGEEVDRLVLLTVVLPAERVTLGDVQDLPDVTLGVGPDELVAPGLVDAPGIEADVLLRDPNKLVQLAVVQSPRISDGEIAKIANSRTSPHEVLQHIYNNRLLLKNYTIKVSLVNNPKVPVAVAMRFLSLLRQSELKSLSKNRNVSNALQTQAKKILEKKA